MACIKCGKKTENEQIFCPRCLSVMEEYPVKPDVHIQLPARRATPAEKKAGRKRRAPSLEEQVASLRSWRKWLILAVAILVVLTVLMGVFGAKLIRDAAEKDDARWGKNYTSTNPLS